MKIIFTFERTDLQNRAMDWFNFLTFLGHEVYLLNSTDYDKQIFHNYKTRIQYVEDVNFIDECDYWFYDITPKVWDDSPKMLSKMRAFKGELFCVNFEDGYVFFEKLIDGYIRDKTRMFINNALWIDRAWYKPEIHPKIFLTTSYITNSQPFGWSYPVAIKDRKKRIHFSGALTGFPSILSNHNKEEFKLRYTLTKKIVDIGIDHVIRFTGCDPDLQDLYNEIPPDWKISPLSHMDYLLELMNSLICLAVKGNSFPTNRFYESQAASCLTFTNPLHREFEFYGTGTPGKNYVEINIDGSDIGEKFHYYSTHLKETEEITLNGRKNWEEYIQLDKNLVWPKKTFDYHVQGIKEISGIDITII